MTSPAEPRLVVAIATFRRPQTVRATLDDVLAQLAAVPGARVLVVDNDPAASARDLISRPDDRRVDYVVEPSPGIAAARNRALDEARGDLLVFIDDDETPDPGWLAALVHAWRRYDAQAVAGPVRSVFAHDPAAWITAGGFFERRRPDTGTVVRLAATNNLLLDLAFVHRARLRFDERFGLSGGSDTLFTHQLSAAGGRIVWCAEAVVVDHVPAERLTRQWVLARAMRYGNSAARVAIVTAGGPPQRWRRRAVVLAQGVLRLAAGTARAALGRALRSDRHRARGQRTAMKGIGYLRAALGSTYVEYARRADV